jgi:competence protein ComEC
LIYLVALLSGAFASQVFPFFPYSTAFILLPILFFLVRRKQNAVIVLVLISALYCLARHEPPVKNSSGRADIRVEGHFTSPAVSRRGGYVQEFRPSPPIQRLSKDIRSVDVLSGEEYEIGRRYELDIELVKPKNRLNPGSWQRRPYAVLSGVVQEKGEVSSISVFFNRMRDRLNRHIRQSFGAEQGAFIMAVTTGHRGEMGYDLRDAFNAAGVAHLLAISGTHFGLFSLLLFGLFRAAVKHLPLRLLEKVTVYLTPAQSAVILTLPFMLFYLGISEASIPSLRAFTMIGLFMLGLLLGRKGAWLNFLLLAAVLLVIWDPDVLGSLSFQLSFMAVLFIGFGLSAWARRSRPDETDTLIPLDMRPEKDKKTVTGYVRTSFLITFFASLGVSPLVAYYFHYASLISPVANLIVTPLVCFLMVPLALVGSFVYLLTGSFVLGPLVEILSGLSINLVRIFSSVPYASVRVAPFPPALLVFFYVGFLLFWSIRKRWFLLIALLPMVLYMGVAAVSSRPLGVTFLDAGRADAMAVELPDGKVLAVDTGRRGREIADFLRFRAVSSLDALVLTHGHPDHAGGAERVIRQFDVKEVWDSGRLVYPRGFETGSARHRTLLRGDVIEGEGYKLKVLHPYEGFYSGDRNPYVQGNNDSLVIRLEGRKSSFLFAGDVENRAAGDMLRQGVVLKSSVLKVPQHGMRRALHRGFLRAVSPNVAVVTGSRIHNGVARELDGSEILVTGRDGAVKVEERKDGIRVKTYKEYRIVRTGDFREEIRNVKRLFDTW